MEIYEYANPESCGRILIYPVASQERAQFFTVNIQDGTERNVIAFFISWTSVSSFLTRVRFNLAKITAVQLNYAKRRLNILSFYPCRTDELDAVNKLNERLTSAWWDNSVRETVIEEDWG